MGSTLSAVVVDIPKLQSFIGSKDESVIEGVIENNAEFFEEEEEEYDDDELSLSAAIRHLVMNEEKQTDEAHQYGYALQEICDYAGELLDCDVWSGASWVCVEACGLEDLLTKTGPPVALPKTDDFPSIGHITREQLGDQLRIAKQHGEQLDDPEFAELLDEYISWLETAKEKELDLVFFYH